MNLKYCENCNHLRHSLMISSQKLGVYQDIFCQISVQSEAEETVVYTEDLKGMKRRKEYNKKFKIPHDCPYRLEYLLDEQRKL